MASSAIAFDDPDPISRHLEFVENKGQWPTPVKFRGLLPSGGGFFVRNDGYTLALRHPDDAAWMSEHHHGHKEVSGEHRPLSAPASAPPTKIRYEAIEVNFLKGGADNHVGRDQLSYFQNFFKGQDPNKWASDVGVFREVLLQEVYEGISFRLYSDDVLPKYDWVLAPGTSPSTIRMEYRGVKALRHVKDKLVVQTLYNEWVEERPFAYQIIDGVRQKVACQYVVDGTVVGFNFPDGYDASLPLIIDPVLVFSSYTGSTADNWGFTACFDDIGNLYTGGMVFDVGFPVSIGAYQEEFGGAIDMAIFSYDSTGASQRYATYIGGADGETPQSLLVAPDSSLVILGITSSDAYPVSANAFQRSFSGGSQVNVYGDGRDFTQGTDIVISRLSFFGNELLASTYVGGSRNDGYKHPINPISFFYGDDFRGDIIADADGNVYVASTTSSIDFPVANAFQGASRGGANDAVVFSLPPALNRLRWGTYLGGSGEDAAYSVKLDEEGNVLVGGGTSSPDFGGVLGGYSMTHAGFVDGFITRFSPDGQTIVNGTFLGTSDRDQTYFIDLDTAGMVYAFGSTFGDYPVEGTVYSNPMSGQFIHQLSADLSTSNWSTVVGSGSGDPNISPTAFLVNECGNIYFAGWGGSLAGAFGGTTEGMPISSDAFQSTTDGVDFYIAVLNRQATELLYGTFFGEDDSSNPDHVDGGTSRFDKRGIVYHSVCASCGGGNGFPVTSNAWSSENRSENCNNASFKFDLSSIQAILQTNTPERDLPGVTVGCAPFTVLFENQSQGGLEFQWDFGDGEQLVQNTQQDVEHTYDDPGTYRVVLTVVDANTCKVRDSAVVNITATEENFEISDDTQICLGESAQLTASGGVSYLWVPPFGLSDNRSANPVASPQQTTTYRLTAFDAAGCRFQDSIQVKVVGEVGAAFKAEQSINCEDTNEVSFLNLSTNGEDFLWEFGDGNTSTDESPKHLYAEDGNYLVRLLVQKDGCRSLFSQSVAVKELLVPTIITPNSDKFNQRLVVQTTETVGVAVYNRWGEKLFEEKEYQNNWDAKGLADGAYFIEVVLPNEESCKSILHVYR